jgi:hypothetical protein
MKVVSIISLVVLTLCTIICIPAYFDEDFAKAYSVFSNLAYIAPLSVAFVLKNYDFLIVISLVFLVSTLYHICKAYDVCFKMGHQSWEHIDVMFSWYLLLTLAAYLAFPKDFRLLAPINVLILIWSHEAHCKDDYECRNAKLVFLAIYCIFGIVKGARDHEFYHYANSIASIVTFIAASGFYLFGDSMANHSAWHISSALSIALALTMLKNTAFHFLGFVEPRSELATDAEQSALMRPDLRIYYNE